MGKHKHFANFGAILLAVSGAAAGYSAAPGQYTFDIPPQELKFALRAVTRQSGLQLFADTQDLQGRSAAALHATMSPQEAFDQLLSGTGLEARIEGKAVFIRGRDGAATAASAPEKSAEEIVVTGTRIRGAEVASRVMTFNRDDIAFAGQSDLGSFIRTIPANYRGGQNPGIIGGGDQGGQDDVNGASEINLRGLGPDATLTLINGHRVAYDAQSQGIDIAAVPLDAIERVEIVADGSSALYGSDAVGGVANVILRRDYSGVDASARVGAATDGGDFTRQFDLVTGSRWGSGGFMIAGDYNQNGSINADQRNLTRSLDPSATLLPASRAYSGILSGHQAIGSPLTFNIDAQFSDRSTDTSNPAFTDSNVHSDGILSHSHVRTFSIAPSLAFDAGHDWRLTLQGAYGSSNTRVGSISYSSGEQFNQVDVRYNNRLSTSELNAEGPLLQLPGGPIRLAVGAGYRRYSLLGDALTTFTGEAPSEDRFDKQQTVYYGYGEASVPIIGRNNALPWLRDVHFTGAIRYEDYRGVDKVVTPKLGLIVSPIPDITLKASWGRSFKAPTLYEENQIRNAALLPGFIFAPGTPPAGSTVLIIAGGNPDLKPERATTWSTTVTLQPSFARNLKVEATYFYIRYGNRVVPPVTSLVSSLANPAFDAFITRNPSAAQFEDALNSLGLFFNQSGAPVDPSTVAAIIDSSLRNAARQTIQGVDLSSEYTLAMGARDHIAFTADATYLESRQQLSAAQPVLPLAGTIFHPPHWRARAGAEWVTGNWRLGGYFNYTGGLTDTRHAPFVHVGAFETVDLSVRYAPDQGPLAKLSATLSVENLLNAMPARITNSNPADPPFDTTNYSAIGRFVALTLTRQW